MTRATARKNEAVSQLLDNIARLLTLKGDDPYRIGAYLDAARTVGGIADDIGHLHRLDQLEEIRGVGPSIAARIAEYLDTGRSSYVDDLEREIAPEAPGLLDLPSIGPVRAKLIQHRFGISTVSEVARAAREHRLRALRGIGEALESRIAEEAEHALQAAEGASESARQGGARRLAVPAT